MQYTNELELWYFSDKKPLLKIMKEYADYSCETWMTREGSFRNYVVVNYEIGYDFKKLINNLSVIKEKAKRLKAYKKCEEFRDRMDSIPNDYRNYKRYTDLIKWEGRSGDIVETGMVSDINFLLEFCRKESGSYSLYYDVKNDIRNTYEFQVLFKDTFDKPMFSLVEVNGWEREMWKWWTPLKNENDMRLLSVLNNRLIELGKVDQKIGESSYSINFALNEFDSIKFDSQRCSYMDANNLLEGEIDHEHINKLIKLGDQELFEALYKGGLTNVIKKGEWYV